MDQNAVKAYQNLGNIGKVTTPYGGKTAYEQFHGGVDVANKKGTPIPAFANGVVTAVVGGYKNGDNGYGNSVIVTDKNGDKHRYSHLHKSFVVPGQKVSKGQPLAQMGDSGSSYSPSGGDSSHLDYRVVSAYGQMKNPLTYIKNINTQSNGQRQ